MKVPSRKNHNHHRANGASLIEFALLLPVLMGVGVVGYYVTAEVGKSQRASYVVREIAFESSRECGRLEESLVQGCLESRIAATFSEYLDSYFPNSRAIISVYVLENNVIDFQLTEDTVLCVSDQLAALAYQYNDDPSVGALPPANSCATNAILLNFDNNPIRPSCDFQIDMPGGGYWTVSCESFMVDAFGQPTGEPMTPGWSCLTLISHERSVSFELEF